MLLSFQNVSVRRYDTVIFDDFNWQVRAGEQWAVVGENGSGKTTLLEVLAGKWPVWRGRLTHGFGEGVLLHKVAELVASDYSFNRIVRSAAQYYQQRFHSYEAEIAPTVREVLTHQLRPVGTVNPNSVTVSASNISESDLLKISDLLSLTPLLDRPFVTLSNGETRRMLLARSLLKKPQMLLLDNPFAGLDVRSREVLRHALGALKDEGVLVILVTPETEIPDSVTNVLRVGNASVQPSPMRSENAKLTFQMPHYQQKQENLAIEMRNINVVYGQKKVLDNINWEVKVGEKWALMGPNGSGKSTLLSILTADNPQRFANDYSLFGKKRGGASMWDAKRIIGHVSPELHLYFPQETTVFKAIASGFFDATGVYFRKLTDEQTATAHQVAHALHVGELLQKPFKNISKGHQRLVLLARALVKNPPLLILDEPCQGLDFAAVEHFKSLIDQVCQDSSHTLVYVSHYPHEIPSCVTHTLRLEEGRVV
ncbi:MAG: ATP-binding cassette domain-containing protein [Spirosomaceae bacterium]|nr:ATP-binding cassette domain-containing protein [Spirosomataceae bacterium]